MYYENIQQQLYKWYTLSIFDNNKKTQYINSKEQQKLINKALKEERNQQILWLKDEGFTQKEVAEMLNISLRTVKNYWNK
jgi:DNA-binding NarL/FixJ family response regulator